MLLKGTLRPFLTWPRPPSSLITLSACSSVDTPSCSSCLQANPPGHHHHHLVTPYTRSPKPDGLEDNALSSCHTAPAPGGTRLPTLRPLGTPSCTCNVRLSCSKAQTESCSLRVRGPQPCAGSVACTAGVIACFSAWRS